LFSSLKDLYLSLKKKKIHTRDGSAKKSSGSKGQKPVSAR